MEVETKLLQLQKQKEEIYAKAKEDARREDKAKTEKYLNKIERIKQQEIAQAKKNQKDELNQLRSQIKQIEEKLEALSTNENNNFTGEGQKVAGQVHDITTPE